MFIVYMTTELVSFKLDNKFLKEIDNLAKEQRFHSRTEFIRSALREKVEKARVKQAMVQIAKLKGSSNKKTTDEDLERIREEVFNELDRRIT